MNPLRVMAANYGPYADLDWEIPNGLTAILGVNGAGEGVSSNGAGKTKLLEAIRIALFGPELPWGELLTTGSDPDAICQIEMEFEHNGSTYRVRRSFSAKGRGKTTCDFEQWVDDNA